MLIHQASKSGSQLLRLVGTDEEESRKQGNHSYPHSMIVMSKHCIMGEIWRFVKSIRQLKWANKKDR